MTDEQKTKIEEILRTSLRRKLENYKPESDAMPFHTRLLGKDRMALFSFIQSLNTTFGSAIFEPVAAELARSAGFTAELQVNVGNEISAKAASLIQEIMRSIETAEKSVSKSDELAAIRKVANVGDAQTIRTRKVDLKVVSKAGEIFLFDIKSAKPNL
ncbi:MAG: TdeIII family type II restriction endonuclease, partial [Holosporaceae bacterium]|nr:TdeIII family type II restriction endonuclease [Holosporaceae bacterium]